VAAWPKSARATSSSGRWPSQGVVRLLRSHTAVGPAGDIIQMLNIGGVLGVCDSVNPDKGKPFDCRVIAACCTFPTSASASAFPPAWVTSGSTLKRSWKLAGAGRRARRYLYGSRKTAAACAVISRMRHRGFTIDAFKATGVSLRRDILAMEDAGARNSMIFTDMGHRDDHEDQRSGTHAHHVDELSAGKPDAIVFELGDGILGTYGVDAILECPDIRAALTGVILSANDPVAAWGGVKLLRERFGIEPCVGRSAQVAYGLVPLDDGGRTQT